MRAPQASIIALLDHNDPGDWGPETAQRIKTYARRTLKLADDFVHLSRAQILQYELATLNIVDIAYDAIDALWPQARLRQISLDVTIEDDEILIRGEHSLLMRALINLLDNAVKFSTDSSVVRFAMSRTLREQREFVVCSVIDTGVGIPPEKMATLFSRFASARPNPTGGVGGVGLGLAFVKTVVTRHGGTIHCDSQEGKGTTFRIELPAVAGTPESGTIAA
jgi:signal transduction histidine kinase